MKKNTLIIGLIITALIIAGVIIFSVASAGKEYRLTLTHSAGGTVSGEGKYRGGKSVTVRAVAGDGYGFSGWFFEDGTQEGGMDSEAYTFKMPKNGLALRAEFIEGWRLTLTAETGGSVTGAGFYEFNQSVTVKAVADSGYEFIGWYNLDDVCVSHNAEYTFNINNARSLTAKFEYRWELKLTGGQGGTTSGGGRFIKGQRVTVTAVADAGYVFDGWFFEDDTQTEAMKLSTYVFDMPGKNVTLQAKFVSGKLLSLICQTGGGTLEGAGYYKAGAIVTVNAKANNGYVFAGWFKEGGEPIATQGTSYTLTMPDSGLTLYAKFELGQAVKHRFGLENSDGGTVAQSGDGNYALGESVTVIAEPASGYIFAGWYHDGGLVSESKQYSFNMPDGDYSLRAEFKVDTSLKYAVRLTTEAGGTHSGAGTFEAGAIVTVNAAPNAEYDFLGWYSNGAWVSSDLQYTFTMPAREVTLYARFFVATGDAYDWYGGASDRAAEGTETDPYVLLTKEELAAFRELVNYSFDLKGKYFVLGRDVDLGGVVWEPVGWTNKDNPYEFSGHFNGAGHTVSGFVINETSYDGILGNVRGGATQAYGFFGCVNSAVIENLNLANFTFDVKSVQGDVYAGGLIGRAGNTVVSGCSVQSAVSVVTGGDSETAYAGGLIGYIGGTGEIGFSVSSFVSHSQTAGAVSLKSAGAEAYAGGLLGGGSSVSVDCCYAAGNVTLEAKTAYAGGLIACLTANSEVLYSYAKGGVTATAGAGDAYAGGFIGYADGGVVKACLSAGNLNASSGAGDVYAGGFIGYGDGDYSSSYRFEKQTVTGGTPNQYAKTCTEEQLYRETFYTQILGWSVEDWSFASGRLPVLK